MVLHNAPLFQLYFGDSSESIYTSSFSNAKNQNECFINSCVPLKKMACNQVVFLRQIHGSSGLIIDEKNKDISPFVHEGDFLITHLPRIGLGILTADCLPIICYDTVHNCIGIAHAGWKGAVKGVATAMLEHMKREYGTNIHEIKLFFGPSAKICCYEVSDIFKHNLEDYSFADQVLQQHDQQLFFDLPGFNRLQLESIGVVKEAFHFDYNSCTICNNRFCSHRRASKTNQVEKRQMTIVCLK